MPKFKRPKKGCGLNLRGVIEGELLSKVGNLPSLGGYGMITAVVDAIEKRIKDGPSDWLSLSDGTTFDKSWTPEEVEPQDKLDNDEASVRYPLHAADCNVNVGFSRGEICCCHGPIEPLPAESSPRPVAHPEEEHEFFPAPVEDKLGALGHDSNRLLVKSLDNIHFEHEKRVAAHKLEKEIQAHEDWLEFERNRQ